MIKHQGYKKSRGAGQLLVVKVLCPGKVVTFEVRLHDVAICSSIDQCDQRVRSCFNEMRYTFYLLTDLVKRK